MKFVKISHKELKQTAKFYESVMATAYEGLFYREGKAIGKVITEVLESDDAFLQKAGKLVKARGWADSLALEDQKAIAKDSVEVDKESDTKTCHRLRGIICSIYEKDTGNIVEVREVKCQSLDDEHCEFEVDFKKF